MRRVVKNTARFFIVTVGIIVLTSFTIDATDALRGSQSALSILAKQATQERCPEGTAEIELGDRSFCMDIFENVVGESCVDQQVQSVLSTKKNISQSDCGSVSESDRSPWTYVSFHQAKELCAKRDMRLPTSAEWYEGVLGTPADGACNVDGQPTRTGALDSCVSARGMYDMVGNVWEWVDEEVANATYHDRQLPEEGYVTDIDATGVAVATSDRPSELYDNDYFWSSEGGSFALMRGGYHGSGDDAGLYAVHAKTAPSFASQAIGFRCVKDL